MPGFCCFCQVMSWSISDATTTASAVLRFAFARLPRLGCGKGSFAMLQIIADMWYCHCTPVGMTANRFNLQGCAPFAGCGAYPRERGSTSMLDVGEQRKQRHMFKFGVG